jgi:hypothetical protein
MWRPSHPGDHRSIHGPHKKDVAAVVAVPRPRCCKLDCRMEPCTTPTNALSPYRGSTRMLAVIVGAWVAQLKW